MTTTNDPNDPGVESTTSGDVTPGTREGDKGDGPASNETSGVFPADDVNDDPAATYTTVGVTDHDDDDNNPNPPDQGADPSA